MDPDLRIILLEVSFFVVYYTFFSLSYFLICQYAELAILRCCNVVYCSSNELLWLKSEYIARSFIYFNDNVAGIDLYYSDCCISENAPEPVFILPQYLFILLPFPDIYAYSDHYPG